MTAARALEFYRMRSKECVDGYGLVLVGMQLYESLCTAKSHVDQLCKLARTFKRLSDEFQKNYVTFPLHDVTGISISFSRTIEYLFSENESGG